jgi:two-component system chemotaxis sensor kinase CheA
VSFQSLAGDFAAEALELIDQLEQTLLSLESEPPEKRAALAASAKRTLHTLKGNAGLVGAVALQTALHRMEDVAAELVAAPESAGALLHAIDAIRTETHEIAEGRSVEKPSAAILSFEIGKQSQGPTVTGLEASEELKVHQSRIDELVATAGDLTVQNARLQALSQSHSIDPRSIREVADRLDAAIRRLHGQVLRVRMVPARQLLSRFRRLVRDEALACGKKASLRLEGADVAADKVVLDHLSRALVHLVRNAVAHGIEKPEVRVANGKPAEGVVTLSAAQFGDRVEIAVSDDGKGLDHEAIARRAKELGMDPGLGDSSLIFEAGFSTARLSQSAGRGVGLDAVKRVVFAIGGTIDLQSRPGLGLRVALRVPSSIALQRALLCQVAGETYAVPVASVLEATRIEERQVRWLGEGAALEHRGGLVPIVDQERALGVAESKGGFAIILQADGLAALRVEALLGQQDFVFQPLDPSLRSGAPVSAGALLADGRVVLRLDPDVLVASASSGRAPEVKR